MSWCICICTCVCIWTWVCESWSRLPNKGDPSWWTQQRLLAIDRNINWGRSKILRSSVGDPRLSMIVINFFNDCQSLPSSPQSLPSQVHLGISAAQESRPYLCLGHQALWNCLSLEIWRSLWPESHLPIVFRSNCPLLTNRPRQCFNCSIVRLRRHLFSLKPIVIQEVAFHWFGQTGNLVIQFSCQQLSLRLVACFEICFLASSLWELPEKAREDVFKCLFEALSGNFERQLTQRGLPPATRRLHLELSETVIQMVLPITDHSIEKGVHTLKLCRSQ